MAMATRNLLYRESFPDSSDGRAHNVSPTQSHPGRSCCPICYYRTAAGDRWTFADCPRRQLVLLLLAVGLLAIAVLVWRRDPIALWMGSAVIVLSLIWALFEVGLDWWQLVPRGDLIIVLGILLALPWVVRGLDRERLPRSPQKWLDGPRALAGAGGGGGSYRRDDRAQQRSEPAQLPTRQTSLVDSQVPDGDWQAYGRTNMGQRYSPLSQITPHNVGRAEASRGPSTPAMCGAKDDPGETTYEVTPAQDRQHRLPVHAA